LHRSNSLLLSAFKSYEPCSEPFVETPFVAQPLVFDYVGVNDFYSYKNLDLHGDVNNSFDPNIEATDIFMRQREDSIDRLFEYS